jgi:hypothetical protein
MEISALANRPLPPTVEEFVYSKKGNPVASEDINKGELLPVQTKYSEKDEIIIPVSIEQNSINNDFMVLEGHIYDKVEEYIENDKKGVRTNINNNTLLLKPKMNLSTQFYVGSLTVIGLFVLYRLIQKTK